MIIWIRAWHLKIAWRSFARNLYQQAAASDTFNLDELSASLPTSTGISIDAIQHHKNRKTSNLQTGILTGLLPDYHHYSANGQLAVFRARTNGRWHSQFPECFESYFLDYDDNLHSKPSELESVHDSPPGSSYPKMSEGYLDFGPSVNPCYNDCPLVDKAQLPDYDKIYAVLLHFILLRRNQLKNCQKIQVIPSRVLRAVHLFSQKYYPTRVYPHVAVEAARHGVPTNDISLVQEITTYIWDNETLEIKQDVANCVEKERELITAFKEGTLKASDLSDDKKAAYMIIDSLYRDFEGMFKDLVNYLKWGVVVVAGGVDPRTGRIRRVGYNYGCTTSDGKDFINSFNDAAVAGHIPGTPEGESRAFGQYYGLPFMYHMKKVHLSHNGLAQKENIESPVVVDPATLVYDDATGSAVVASRASDNLDSRPLPVEVSAPIGQPHVGLSAEKSFIPSPVIYPSLAAASTPPSPATASVAPHTPETVFISLQSSASNAFQGLEPLQSGTLMDTSMDFLNVPPLMFSHSDDLMRPFHSVTSPQAFFPGIDDNYSGAHPAGSQ
ncbi:hypothetical protein F5146DRAFT_1138968 [Armillaria mellea]|nr:hypothetical protein F5146DRAFT_1138968 [Armillaria mellea]